jgi:NAD(P)H-hydrate epimerase
MWEMLDGILLLMLLRIGFKGSLNEYEARIVQWVNHSRLPVLSVDIPSGVEADSGRVKGEAVKAAATVTFALPKPGLILEPGKNYTSQLSIADISILRLCWNTNAYKPTLSPRIWQPGCWDPEILIPIKGHLDMPC